MLSFYICTSNENLSEVFPKVQSIDTMFGEKNYKMHFVGVIIFVQYRNE